MEEKVRKNSGKWIDTSPFRRAALHYERHGVYTFAPPGSDEYIEFWTAELVKCRDGYEYGGSKITGNHYFYLNYCPLKRSGTTGKSGVSKQVGFPDFWDYDYDFFWVIEIAKNGITKKELDKLKLKVKPLDLDGGKHIIVNKARRRGYSYKVASICTNQFNTRPNSLSLLGAAERKYLYPKGTMTMIKNNLDFLNSKTAWGKKREFVDRQEHMRASYSKMVDGVNVEAGYKSEIIAITYNDNPDAARGKDADLIAYDEAGVFNNLEASYAATRPVVEDGGLITGQIIVFGTSGIGASAEYSNMFYSPDQYNFLRFSNIWDEEAEDQEVGFFHPVWANMTPYIDSAGNSLIEEAVEAEKKAREKLSPAALRARQMEYPISPSEAFLTGSANSFPIMELKRQLAKVRSDPAYKNRGVAGHFEKTEDGVVFKPDLRNIYQPVDSYDKPPIDLTGCAVIYEQPEPNAIYIIGYDPVFQDKSSDSKPSLASAYVMKTYANMSITSGTVVANYVGRPNEVDDAHRIVCYLAEYFNNAEVMHENMARDVKTWFLNNKKLHLLAVQPDAIINANIKNSKVARQWGVHMPIQLKEAAEKYLKSWLLEETQVTVDGEPIQRLETIYDQGLLEELIKYNLKGNFDRVISMFLLMLFIKNNEERYKSERKQQESTNIQELADFLRKKYPKNAPRQTQINAS